MIARGGRWLRAPGLHFLVLGGLLYAARAVLPGAAAVPDRDARAPLVISHARIAELHAELTRRFGRSPTAAQLDAAIAQAVDEELLEREARRLALDVGDRAIRQRLVAKMRAVARTPSHTHDELYEQALALGFDDDVIIRRLLRQKMRVLLERGATDAPLTDDDLRRGLARHRQRFVKPARVTLSQVFISDRHGDRLAERAAEVRGAIVARRLASVEAAALGDHFPLAAHATNRSRAELAERFGDDFARRVMALVLHTWSRPIASPFGLHLVRVEQRTPQGLPPLDQVRGQLARLLEEERAAARLRAGLDRLRARYRVRIESDGPA